MPEIDLRQQELQGSVFDRLFVPAARGLPSVQIRSMANKRQNGIRRQLPDVMDL